MLTPRSLSGASVPAPLRLEGGAAIIGRDRAAQLRLDNPQVSSRHCTIARGPGGWEVHDTSTNGTFVNGQRVAGQQALRDGDVVAVAEFEVLVSLSGEAPAGASAPGPGSSRQAATQLPAGGAARTMAPQSPGADTLLTAAVEGLASLAATRRKARSELGVADANASDPFANPRTAAASLLSMNPAQAGALIARLCCELEEHDKALLAAMQAAFHHALDQFSPAAIKQRHRGEAEAWNAYERGFGGADGFVETFAKAFAEAYGRPGEGSG